MNIFREKGNFVMEDSDVSQIYAQNVVQGNGLTQRFSKEATLGVEANTHDPWTDGLCFFESPSFDA